MRFRRELPVRGDPVLPVMSSKESEAATAFAGGPSPDGLLGGVAHILPGTKRPFGIAGTNDDDQETPVYRPVIQAKGMRFRSLGDKVAFEEAGPATPDPHPDSTPSGWPSDDVLELGITWPHADSPVGLDPGLGPFPDLGWGLAPLPDARPDLVPFAAVRMGLAGVVSEPRASHPSLGLGWDTELLGRTGGVAPVRCGKLRPHFPILEAPPGEAQVDMRLAGTAAGMPPLRFEEHFYDGHHFCAPLPYEYDTWPRCGDLGVDMGGRQLPFDATTEAELLLGYGKQQQPKERQPEGRVESIAEGVSSTSVPTSTHG